jgi:hypothetical protein
MLAMQAWAFFRPPAVRLIALDIFNVTNSNTTDAYQASYSPTLLNSAARYLNPLSIIVS